MNDKELSEKKRGLGVPFSRIRRITGYLVGDMSLWNTGKKEEEKDRVSHYIRQGFCYIEMIICLFIILSLTIMILPKYIEVIEKMNRIKNFDYTTIIEDYSNLEVMIDDDNILSQYIGK